MDPRSASGTQPTSVFVVSKVVNASGGSTGCFLYQGSLVTPALCASTPDRRSSVRSAEGEGWAQQGPGLGGQLDLAEYEGQQLTLYLSYEEASPKLRRVPADAAAAPWRAILRDQADELVFCMKGLPTRVCLDVQERLVTWGPSIALCFPTPGKRGSCCLAGREGSFAPPDTPPLR